MSDKNRMDNMDDLKDQNVFSNVPSPHMQSVPSKAASEHAKKITKDSVSSGSSPDGGEDYNLNDDRRVKVLSPGALVAKRFFRNRIAMVGLITLTLMFLFSFLGGIIMNALGYDEKQQYHRYDDFWVPYAYASEIEPNIANMRFYFVPEFENNDSTPLITGKFRETMNVILTEQAEEAARREEEERAAAETAETADPETVEDASEKDETAPEPKKEYGEVVATFKALCKFNGDKSLTNRTFNVIEEGRNYYVLALEDGTEIAIGYTDKIYSSAQDVSDDDLSYAFKRGALKAYTNDLDSFDADGMTYNVDEVTITDDKGGEVGYISSFVFSAKDTDVKLSRSFQETLSEQFDVYREELKKIEVYFNYVDEKGEDHRYQIKYDPDKRFYVIAQVEPTFVLDTYSAPTLEHPLGTDKDGRDMLTRLMYGGRVSLIIGFIVEIISTVIGVILGGISGYFGKWVDNLIMRIVDIFYCIPSTPLLIILGAAMDHLGPNGTSVNSTVRMVFLMLVLGFLGWPGIARLVRGQILSLREQEFMTATEATGLSVHRRIFKHLVPNVIPQLIVSCTMGLGGTIIMEATLSFLGLGVKQPYASWGNIINAVFDSKYVLENYWFAWIPAGMLLLITVLAFNLVGDGLRDAFDPKMKR